MSKDIANAIPISNGYTPEGMEKLLNEDCEEWTYKAVLRKDGKHVIQVFDEEQNFLGYI